MKQRYFKYFIVLTSVILFLLLSTCLIFAKTTIKIGFSTSEEHPVFAALKNFKVVVEEETAGDIEVSLFPNSMLGDDREMIEQLIAGALDMYQGSTAMLSSYVPKFLILDFPFLWPNSETQHKALDGEFGSWLKNLSYKRGLGFKVLNYWDAGFMQLTTNRHPVSTPSDLKGLKIRLMENPIHLATFRAFSATVETIPFGELYSALQQGVVDGQENTIPIIHAMHYYEVVKYLNTTRHFNTPLCLVVSSNTWDKLSEDRQELILKAADFVRDQQRWDNHIKEGELIDDLVNKGMILNELTEQLKLFQDKVHIVYDEFVKDIGEEIFARLMNDIEKTSECSCF